MALTKLTTDLNIIAPLDNEPNDVGGLTSTQLKAKFDEGGNAIKDFINNTLTPELDAGFATKAEVQGIVLGQVPDGGLTQAKLDTALNAKINGAVSTDDVYSKPETLSDSTCASLNLPTTSVPDDALGKIATFGVSKKYFTSSGTFTAPHTGSYFVELCGGGSYGESNQDGWGVYTSAGGGYAAKTVYLAAGQNVSITVGSGGNSASQSGKTSSFGSYLSAAGGTYTGTASGQSPGTGVGGDINVAGSLGNIAVTDVAIGGASYLGMASGKGNIGWGYGGCLGSTSGKSGIVIIHMLDKE